MKQNYLRTLMSRRTRGVRLLVLLNIFLLGYLASVLFFPQPPPAPHHPNPHLPTRPDPHLDAVLQDQQQRGEERFYPASAGRGDPHLQQQRDPDHPLDAERLLYPAEQQYDPHEPQPRRGLRDPRTINVVQEMNVYPAEHDSSSSSSSYHKRPLNNNNNNNNNHPLDVVQSMHLYPEKSNPLLDPKPDVYAAQMHSYGRHLLANGSDGSNYPKDLLSLEQRRDGAVVLHVLGMVYMFVALAVVCDEFFVPALTVITERLAISEDVAGATFMAAGGSAPELFTSFIGVFIAKTDVGIGTIVGSAVFNILFVIGMCALFSKELLHLTWWPLFRDVLWYSISLLLLIYFFEDEKIYWWEALILFSCYFGYVTFMKFNHIIEAKIKGCLRRSKTVNKVQSTDHLIEESQPPPHQRERLGSLPVMHAGAGRYRHGVLQLMIHTIDPLTEADDPMTHRLSARRASIASRRHSIAAPRAPLSPTEEGKVQDKAVHLQAIATVQLVINHGTTPDQNGTSQVDRENNVKIQMISNGRVSEEPSPAATPNSQQTSMTMLDRPYSDAPRLTGRDVSVSVQGTPQHTVTSNDSTSDTNGEGQLEEEDEPLDLSWPDSCRKRLTYVLLAPIVFPLWITLPDVRRPEKKKWFPVTFICSILWIAVFSYLMVWWANQTGETIGITDEVMGLTILAAGTSIPDLITSVIVAKKGFGDMAVSSSVGSNIFDITVGLPVPWILYGAINGGDPYTVSSKGLMCSIILLFLMLVAVIVSIAVSKWRMSKILGLAMLGLYLVFVTLSVLLEVEVIKCPA